MGGPPVTYQYDADGLLTAAGALQIQRDPTTGFVAGTALGNVIDAHGYNPYGEESSYSASFSRSNLYSVSYTRDATGRIASKTELVGLEPAHTFSYGYDLTGRLTDVANDGGLTARYAYDTNGNRTAGPGLTASPRYDAQDRLVSYGACSYSYKADGSLQTRTCPDGTTSYDYDAIGNLRNVLLPNGTHLDYIIDGHNRRIGKKACATAINVRPAPLTPPQRPSPPPLPRADARPSGSTPWAVWCRCSSPMRLWLSLVFSVIMSGCPNAVYPDALPGTYVAAHPFGSDTITLNRDGTFVQKVQINGDQNAAVARGSWEFDSGIRYVTFHGRLEMADGFGKLRREWRSVPNGIAALPVERLFFKIVLGSGAPHPYVKQ